MSEQVRLQGASIKVSNFMCFGSTPQGFDLIRPVNLIIGRNNTGKTALIEALQCWNGLNGTEVPAHLFRSSGLPELHVTLPLSPERLRQVYPETTSGGGLPGQNWWHYAQSFVGQPAESVINNVLTVKTITLPGSMIAAPTPNFPTLLPNPIWQMPLLRLSSERDIVPEHENSASSLTKNGMGATRILYELFNTAKNARIPEKTLFLMELNKITKPDIEFTSIEVKKGENERWEVFLTESGSDAIQLSSLGSGLKTIILVLLLLHIIPVIDPKLKQVAISNFIFAFEEIENYLHPAIQRRLLAYIRDFALTKGCTIFITSHSNIAIDMFSKDNHAQIVHVTSDKGGSEVARASTYMQHRGILDDLDVRASDLLQSNGIIWVEGPSDRVYLNRWINLWSDGQLSEGQHYQIVFYGGRLLSHLSSADPGECENLVSILRVNKNAAIVIDSDKREEDARINDTKSRLVQEITALGGVAWVTVGREIENYIPPAVIQKLYPGQQIPQSNKYLSFFDILDQIQADEGKRYSNLKPILAEKASEQFEKEDIPGSLDLKERMDQLCAAIVAWNNLRA